MTVMQINQSKKYKAASNYAFSLFPIVAFIFHILFQRIKIDNYKVIQKAKSSNMQIRMDQIFGSPKNNNPANATEYHYPVRLCSGS